MSVIMDVEWVARQDKTARYNNVPETPDYALLHFETGYRFNRHFAVLVGVEHVFDECYADHLGGINRDTGSDVEVGERISGAGPLVYTSADVSF